MSDTKRYLFYFGSSHLEFRVAEVLSIASMFKIDLKIDQTYFESSPFFFVDGLSEEEVVKIASRSVTLKYVLELWGYGFSYEEVVAQVNEFAERYYDYVAEIASGQTYKFVVDAYRSKISYNRKMELIKKFFFLDFSGKVLMDNPQNIFWIEEIYDTQTKDQSESPKEIFFAKQVCSSARDDILTYDLKKRNYLGTTSMDAELSLISSNIGLCRPGTIVLDPFVGTGSFLVTSAHYGSHVMGGDLDLFVLRGNPKRGTGDMNIYSNFEQYNLLDKFLGVIRFDNSKHDVFVFNEYFDAIITDPPYGVREGAKKVGLRKKGDILIEQLPDGWHTHISQTIPYPMCDVISDLFHLAVTTLVLNGRLIFWLPILSSYEETDLPTHPCFELVHSCFQGLTANHGRILLCYSKTVPYNEHLHADYKIEYDPEKPYSNYAMNYLKDPNRHELRYQDQN